jgi:hypothetical protein
MNRDSVKFKQLRFKQIAPYRWIADTGFGPYVITDNFGLKKNYYWQFHFSGKANHAKTIEEAKAACREHYANALNECIR